MYAIRSYYGSRAEKGFPEREEDTQHATPDVTNPVIGYERRVQSTLEFGDGGRVGTHEVEMFVVITSYSIHYTKLYDFSKAL